MPRTSQRVAALHARQALAENDSSDVEIVSYRESKGMELSSEDGEDQYTRPAKKPLPARKIAASKNKISPKLALLDLPLELVTAILTLVDFDALFHLSRCSKRLFRFLRNPAQEELWTSARERSGVPKLGSTVLDVYQGCGKEAVTVNYTTHVRACRACHPKLTRAPTTGQNNKYFQAMQYVVGGYATDPRTGKVKLEYALRDLQAVRCLLRRQALHLNPNAPLSADLKQPDTVDRDPGYQPVYSGHASVTRPYELGLFGLACQTERWNRQTERYDAEQEEVRQAIRDRRRKAFDHDRFQTHAFVLVTEDLDFNAMTAMLDDFDQLYCEIKTECDKKRVSDERVRRRALLEAEHAELFSDTGAARTAGLWPLPAWDELVKLKSVKALHFLSSVKQTDSPDPSLRASAASIVTELQAKREALKKVLFESALAMHNVVDAGYAPVATSNTYLGIRTTSTASSSSSRRANPLKLIDPPASGSKYSKEEVNRFLQRATSLFTCSLCAATDTFHRLLIHPCTGTFSGRSLDPSKYSISQHRLAATVEVLRAANIPVDSPAKVLATLPPHFSCLEPTLTVISVLAQVNHLVTLHGARYTHPSHLRPVPIIYETLEALTARLLDHHVYKDHRLAVNPGGTLSEDEDS
ncbi:hypothetical protein JCM8097_002233 [Rhodosporidiobolus ruineniae]